MRNEKKQKRQKRVRIPLRAQKKHRLVVHRTNKHIFAQIVDDKTGKTLLGVSDIGLQDSKLNKTQKAEKVGEQVAKLALKQKVAEVVFDRSYYRYHGRVKALAEKAREAGLKF